MQLDKFSDYALRVLMYLNAVAPQRASTAEIAGKFAVSEHHLSKVTATLVQAGFLSSVRGRAGGLVLAKSSDEISVGAVIRATLKNPAVAECFAPGGCSCKIVSVCKLRSPLQQAQQAFFAALDPVTLDQISDNKQDLTQALAL